MTRLLAALALGAATLLAYAQFPQKPVRMIIGLGSGAKAE
jgi:hypothetical protein